MKVKNIRWAVVSAVLLGVLLTAQTVMAHTRVEIDPYVVVVGWLREPPVVGERNALVFEFSEGDQPVIGVEAELSAEILYAGRTFSTNLTPTETPGVYTAELFPTVRGQYEVRLFGKIGQVDVDETIEPEEVFPAARIQFPQAQPDPIELQEEIAALQASLQSARILAYVGIGLGLLGFVLALITLLRRK